MVQGLYLPRDSHLHGGVGSSFPGGQSGESLSVSHQPSLDLVPTAALNCKFTFLIVELLVFAIVAHPCHSFKPKSATMKITAAIASLSLTLITLVEAQDSIVGTWTTKSRKVFTGPVREDKSVGGSNVADILRRASTTLSRIALSSLN